MTKKSLFLPLLSLAILAAALPSSGLAANADFISCGDNVVEVNPNATSLAFSQNANFSTPSDATGYFYTVDNTYSGTYNPQSSWPKMSGEMCDGVDSTILCRDCTLAKERLDQAGECSYSTPGVVATCGKGVGNGIIQPGNGFGEECDDGNVDNGDGCSAFGKIERAENYVPTICGNGTLDAGESCDDGNNRGGDGCSSTCKHEGGVACRNTPTSCGNGRIDYALGEQCDGGDDCSDNCVLKASPVFNKNRRAFWPIPDDLYVDTGTASKPVGVTDRNNTKVRSMDELFSGSGADAAKIVNRGQKVIIPRRQNHQFAGVLLSGQKIENLKVSKGSPDYIFKDGKIHFNMVVSMPTEYTGTIAGQKAMWDDDAFGIVFGIKEGDQSNHSNHNYLMLSWRSLPPSQWQQSWVYPGCENGSENNLSLHGPNGLRLYQITGAPSYTQLWTMSQDCTRDYNGNDWETAGSIKEIATDSTDDWDLSQKPWRPGENSWNRVINPFLPLNTFYALEFGIGEDGLKQRLQIDAEFSLKELKVWVNRQLAIHVIREKLPNVVWPESGELGFYFMGMDNLAIDTSGTYASIKDNTPLNPASSMCNDFCGDGVAQSPGKCDDGNAVDYDGCNSSCEISDHTLEGQCREIEGTKLCYGGSIDSPKDGAVAATEPEINGSYSGSVDDIVVEVKDADGSVICKGSVRSHHVVKGDGMWRLKGCDGQTKPLKLTDGTYQTTVSLIPPQTLDGKNFPPATENATFTVTKKQTWMEVDHPLAERVEVAPTNVPTEFEVTGRASSDVNSVEVQVCTKTQPEVCANKNQATKKNDGKWYAPFPVLPPECQTKGETCLLKITATDAAGAPLNDLQVTKEIILTGDYNLPRPTLTPPGTEVAFNYHVLANTDNTITLQGTLPNQGPFSSSCIDQNGLFKKDECAQVYATVTLSCDIGGRLVQQSTTAALNQNLTYSIDASIPKECILSNKVNFPIKAKVSVSDDQGRFTEGPELPLQVLKRGNPIISFTCPTNTNPDAETCKLVSQGTNTKKVTWLNVVGQTNIQSQRPVVVKVYKKENPDDVCKVAELKTKTPDRVVSVVTTNQGKWSANIKYLPSSSYCLVADLKSQNGSETIASTLTHTTYTRPDITQNDVNQPFFLDTPSSIAQKIVDARKKHQGNVAVALGVKEDAAVAEGDSCVIQVEGDDAWKAQGIFKFTDGHLSCSADLPISKDGQTLLGKKLTGVAIQTGGGQKSPKTTPLLIPNATLTYDGNGTITYTTQPGYPVPVDKKVTFKDAGGVVGECMLEGDDATGYHCTTKLTHTPTTVVTPYYGTDAEPTTVTIPAGAGGNTVDGIVSGGCATTPTDTTLLGLLVGALGVVLGRRRRKGDEVA